MNSRRDSAENMDILGRVWRDICSYKGERQVGRTGEHPSTPGCGKYPPQVIENRKFTGVSLRPRIDLFSTGNRGAEKGNTLGYRDHGFRGNALHGEQGTRI